MATRIAPADTDYNKWTSAQLIERIQDLELQLQHPSDSTPTISTSDPSAPNPETFTSFPIPSAPSEQPQHASESQPPVQKEKTKHAYKKSKDTPPRKMKAFDPSKYSTRLIALKFAYLGQKYNGFEHHKGNKTPLPTIEEEVWKAMMKTRLISPTHVAPADTRGNDDGGHVNGQYSRLGRNEASRMAEEGVEVNWEGCEYSKCGRTDRGVSAFGQVIGVRVRSNRQRPKSPSIRASPLQVEEEVEALSIEDSPSQSPLEPQDQEESREEAPFDDLKDELPYIQLLNRVLPPDIRFYAWCPNPPPGFSARFSCKERRYKYFFTNPCFAPVPGDSALYTPDPLSSSSSSSREGDGEEGQGEKMREAHLDIPAMRTACSHLLGLHDFRNFCKIDASKQLTNFKRRIFHASIDRVSPLSIPSFLSHASLRSPHHHNQDNTAEGEGKEEEPAVYCLTLHGSAFLWHQVRSLVSILFLIGQRLEPPSIIPSLLDISTNPTRPKYEMASDAPLVLWDCIFPTRDSWRDPEAPISVDDTQMEMGGKGGGYEDALEWIYVGDPGAQEVKGGKGTGLGLGKWGRGGVVDDVWEVWRSAKIDETLSGLLLDVIAGQGKNTLDSYTKEGGSGSAGDLGMRNGPRVFDGGDMGRAKGKYTPLLQRERQEPVEVVNERYARRKGLRAGERRVREEDGDE